MMTLKSTRVILVPTDFSRASAQAATAAAELAELLGASVELLHVSAPVPAIESPPGGLLPTEGSPVLLAEHADSGELNAVAERLRQRGIKCSTARTMGKTHVEIVAHARKIAAGLIVMGSHEHSGIAATLLGHVYEKVVRHAPCPVLVVPLQTSEAASIPEDDDPLGLSFMSPLVGT